MGERVEASIEVGSYAAGKLERLMRYGEHLVAGMLPIVERVSPSQLPEPRFERNSSWQQHNLDLRLTGQLVGQLDVDLLEGNGVSQLFLNLHYVFPRAYLVASQEPPLLTPIRVTGRSLFIDGRQRAGAVAHVREVFEDDGRRAIPLWAFKMLDRYECEPWPIVQCAKASDAVDAFQRRLSRSAVQDIQLIYDEVAAEYGYVNFRQFSWQTFQPRVI